MNKMSRETFRESWNRNSWRRILGGGIMKQYTKEEKRVRQTAFIFIASMLMWIVVVAL